MAVSGESATALCVIEFYKWVDGGLIELQKRFIAIFVCMLIFIGSLSLTARAADEAAETLTIKGDGVSREMTFSRAELEAMQAGIVQTVYSATNNYPSNKTMYRRGISLEYLLAQAGLKDSAKVLKFTSSDGYSRTFTRQELLIDPRYYFASTGAAAPVLAIIAWADSSKGFDTMAEMELALTMGQRVKEEQTHPWFVKYLQTIEVSTAEPEQWAPVTFSKAPGPNGVSVTLQHPNFDAVKIYYTTDGTNPTLHSNVYNISASYYQPQLNQPLVLSGDTEIRAVAIGAGKLDSVVASTAVVFAGAGFIDLGNYSWARLAIEELYRQGIINGMGGSRFAPEDPLTRAQFAKMAILALGEKPQTGTNSRFSDVRSSDWYCGYVEKAAALGMIKGYHDGTFRPDQSLSRQEMLTIVVQARGVKVETGNGSADLLAPFADETRISDWARAYVCHAEKIGLLEHGHMVLETGSGLSFDAEKQASRAEAAMTIYRMLQ